jgi:uncharacterized membrane protein (DUF106 family)
MFEQLIAILNTISYPPLALALLAAIVTCLVYALNRLVVKRQVLEEIKAKMAEIRENLNLAQQAKNVEAVEKWMKEFVSVNNKYIKLTVKSMIVTAAVSIIVLTWIGSRYSGNVVRLPFEIPYLGGALSGVYWYVLVSVIVGWVINKLLGG